METFRIESTGMLLEKDPPESLNPEYFQEQLNVLKIQRSCVHDGPGVRTTVFFRGCHLRCSWCQNPEALSFNADPGDKSYSVGEILEVIGRDKEYFAKTNGGVTFSGGEPLLQDSAGLVALMKKLKLENIHIAVETSLHVPWENVAAVVPYVDLFLIDLKITGNDDLHKKYTRQDSVQIRKNIQNLAEIKAGIKFRMVIVPGFNNAEEQIRSAAEFLKSTGYGSVELLKYYNLYEEKARKLGLEREQLNITPAQSLEAIKKAVDLFSSLGIQVSCYELDAKRSKAVFTQRVHNIQKAIHNSEYHFSLEVSKLKTRFYRKYGFKKPVAVTRAKRLEYVLRNKTIRIYPEELLVGNFTPERVGGQIWEEHYGILFTSILHQMGRQKPVAYKMPFKDKLYFYFVVFPYWFRHSLLMRVNPRIKDFALLLARASDMSTGFNNNLAAIAHFVVNYERVLKLGTSGIIREIGQVQKEMPENDRGFYDGAVIALKALETYAERYSAVLKEMAADENDLARKTELEEMSDICCYVPKNPARTYHEALQSMMFLHIALCIESYENAVSLGRMDQILYPYYQKDREEGRISYEKAKELLALYILKMDEAILVNDGNTYLRLGRLFETMSTDQTLTAGGLGKDGKDATNDLTYMLLDICELQPYAVNMTARIHKDSPPEYLDRIAEIYINGAPMPALYNDHLYTETLKKHYDTTDEDARNYSIIGCVEPNASDDHFGNTDCANMNVTLPLLQAMKGHGNDLWNLKFTEVHEKLFNKFIEYNFSGKNSFSKFILSKHNARVKRKEIRRNLKNLNVPANMEELTDRYQERLNKLANSILADHQKIEKVLRENFTTPLASTLFPHCITVGKDVYDGGAKFNSSGIQAVGITDAADSLFAINEVVFRKKLFTMEEVIEAIYHDFEGERNTLVRKALLEVPKFGQDESDEAQRWVNKVLQIYINALKSVPNVPRNGIYAAGYYALNVNRVYGVKTPSLPSGRVKGTPLANSITPHYGMQMADLLSSLNSVAGIDYISYAPNGTTVTFTIDASLFQGNDGVRNLSGIISTFFDKGGMQFQPNVINREILLDAYKHPENYPFLLVRIAGYCAYFSQLSDELKLEIINRTCYS